MPKRWHGNTPGNISRAKPAANGYALPTESRPTASVSHLLTSSRSSNQRRRLTMPELTIHAPTAAGIATTYLTLPVKFSNKKKLPANPQISDTMLALISHFGSGIPIPLSSLPSGKMPELGRVTFQVVTREAMDSTCESGPMVATRRGMAVEAGHHFL